MNVEISEPASLDKPPRADAPASNEQIAWGLGKTAGNYLRGVHVRQSSITADKPSNSLVWIRYDHNPRRYCFGVRS
jgi:hypothetical protein